MTEDLVPRPEDPYGIAKYAVELDLAVAQVGWNDLDFKVSLLQSQLVTLEDEARWAMARACAAFAG